jgi:hypothetical protein
MYNKNTNAVRLLVIASDVPFVNFREMLRVKKKFMLKE